MAIAPNIKWRKDSGLCLSVTSFCFIAAWGSGICIRASTINAKAKIPIAKKRAGLASAIEVPALIVPIRYPTNTGTIVAPIELIAPPNCKSWLPRLPPPPRVLSIGFTTTFSIHIEKPEINAPVRYTPKLPILPERKVIQTPTKPTAIAVKAVFL